MIGRLPTLNDRVSSTAGEYWHVIRIVSTISPRVDSANLYSVFSYERSIGAGGGSSSTGSNEHEPRTAITASDGKTVKADAAKRSKVLFLIAINPLVFIGYFNILLNKN